MKSIPIPIRNTIIKSAVCIGVITIFGTVMGIVTHDTAMLVLSIMLAVSGALRITPMIRFARGSNFQVLECTVISDKKTKLLNRHKLTYYTEEQAEKTVTINGRLLLRTGNRYRLYLSGSEEEKNMASVPEFLRPGRTLVGYELIQE